MKKVFTSDFRRFLYVFFRYYYYCLYLHFFSPFEANGITVLLRVYNGLKSYSFHVTLEARFFFPSVRAQRYSTPKRDKSTTLYTHTHTHTRLPTERVIYSVVVFPTISIVRLSPASRDIKHRLYTRVYTYIYIHVCVSLTLVRIMHMCTRTCIDGYTSKGLRRHISRFSEKLIQRFIVL